MYNRRPINAKYKTYDKIYFIAPNPEEINNDIKKLIDLFKDHDEFIKHITTYEMTNKDKPQIKTDFISIKMKTTNLNENIFLSIAKKINKKLDTDFKVFIKTANETKYIYTPENMQDKPMELLNEALNKFLAD